jgi:hypothetical protein
MARMPRVDWRFGMVGEGPNLDVYTLIRSSVRRGNLILRKETEFLFSRKRVTGVLSSSFPA